MNVKRWSSVGAGILCAVLSLPAVAAPTGGRAAGGMRSMPVPMQTDMLRQFEPVIRRTQTAPPQPALRANPRFFITGAAYPWLNATGGSRFNLACVDRPGYSDAASSALVFGPPLMSRSFGGSLLAACDGSGYPLREEAPPTTLVPAHNKNALYGRGYTPDADSLR